MLSCVMFATQIPPVSPCSFHSLLLSASFSSLRALNHHCTGLPVCGRAMTPVEADEESHGLLAGAGVSSSPVASPRLPWSSSSPSPSSPCPRLFSLTTLLLVLLPVAWILGHVHGRGWLTMGQHVEPHPAKVTPFEQRSGMEPTHEARIAALEAALADQRESHAASLAQQHSEHSRAMAEARWNVTHQLAALKAQLAQTPSSVLPPPSHPRLAELDSCASDTARHAFIFYGYVITLELMQFIIELSQHTNFGTYVIADREDYIWPAEAEHPRVHLIRLSQAYTIYHNFTHFSAGHRLGVPPQKACMAMDKAMLLARALTQFGESKPPKNEPPFLADVLPTLCRTYCRAWIIEDDAFIPSVQAAVHVNARTAVADFVSPPSRSIAQDKWWRWSITLRLPTHRFAAAIPVEASHVQRCGHVHALLSTGSPACTALWSPAVLGGMDADIGAAAQVGARGVH